MSKADTKEPQVTTREFEIKASGKAKAEKTPIEILGALLKGFIPIWLVRFSTFVHKKSWAWNNRAWREREKKYFPFFIVGAAGCWIVQYIILSLIAQGNPHPVWQFWATLILSNVVLNPLSRRWQKPSFEKFMDMPKRRLKFIEAPDVGGNGYPLCWHPKLGWLHYDFRKATDAPEHYPRHLVVFGAYGYGQFAFALNAIRAAFERLKKVVVIILDADAGGLDFAQLKDLRGIIVYDKPSDCERAIWYVSQEIKRRRKHLDSDAPNIVLIGDMWFGAAMIGKYPDLAYLKGVIEEIVEEGNQFGVNVVAFPPAQFYMSAVEPNLQMHYDRAQFFTRAKYKIKQKTGELIEKNVESPRALTDLFLWDIYGQTYECKGLVPELEQVINRIRLSPCPDAALKLWNRFALFDFPDYPPLPPRKPKDEEPEIDEKTKKWIEWKLRTQGAVPHIGPPTYEYAPQPNEMSANGN